MNVNFHALVPKDFNNNSHVWIYQCNRVFTLTEAIQIEELLKDFAANWKSHGTHVKGYGNLFFGQFIIFMADETASGVSGCSTDSSVRLIKNIEKDFQVDMFDRQLLAFIINERIQMIPLSQVNNFLEEGILSANTLYFNNTILTKEELLNSWIMPVKESWLAKRVPFLSK
ncbi:MAG: hypothetical protein ACRDE5_06120 [Ginsengibacter sp.]